MAFRKAPVFEDPPKCIVCEGVMVGQRWEDGLVCSATCADIWLMRANKSQYDVDQEDWA